MADKIAHINGSVREAVAARPRVPPRQFPPYGREVFEALAAGRSLNVRLYACWPNPWPRAKAHHASFGAASTLVLPADTDPAALRWPPVRDLVADVTGLPGGTLHALARALVRDGLRLGYLFDREHPERSLRVIRKARSR